MNRPVEQMLEGQNNSGKGAGSLLPLGVAGWSWGGFLLNWIWAIGNRTWIGLLALIPCVGVVMAFVLGFKGRQWAWQNKSWRDLDHFNRVQRLWAIWGVVVTCVFFGIGILGILAAIMIPALVRMKS